ncbi:glycosyltransferase family 2 protein [Paenibacillus sp. WQ 127069]|uniref:Glycosyltransferase family 2 protein n=1 Tax=Paenibacillus baimaensis TaxID=2982185 RepID=A0ABT2UGJ2_9BACL|nr:glycosyltransferase family 2 protein [Paenibacillus sp. WQ 127069]MCU6793758.1 glycosyltransferase family 2 protein [Paenibacillus sp. WQ 127069]
MTRGRKKAVKKRKTVLTVRRTKRSSRKRKAPLMNRKPRRKLKMAKVSARYRLGYLAGYQAGYGIGYPSGVTAGAASFTVMFEGTSIIIPTFNQGELLRQCIESISQFTPEPHEIIVIDNASTDNTADYLRTMAGKLRYRINPDNIGFAGGVNQGMKMARGSRLLLLNNDTVVTQGWLTNLHRCLDSDERFGLVGPMTNYISGEQLVATSYTSLEEMHRFAAEFNRPDPLRWKKTARITGFCLLFRRDLFERLGYFDEGFLIGNCEDDDFCLRVRLLGLDLVIAGDSFIHHVGSVSMKALGSEMGEVYGRNLDYYAKKWGSVDQLISEMEGLPANGERRSMIHYYPDHAVVQGSRGTVYELHAGVRRLLTGTDSLPVSPARLSHVELRGCIRGNGIHADEVRNRAHAMADPSSGVQEGTLLQKRDGQLFLHEGGRLRRIVSELAISVWGFDRQKPVAVNDSQLSSMPIGLPIIAPITLRSDNI